MSHSCRSAIRDQVDPTSTLANAVTDAEKIMGSTNVPSYDESSAEEKLLCVS